MELNSELAQQLNDKITGGQELLSKVSQFSDVNGISKLQKKIKQEINFLVKTLKLGRVKKEHLLCTNLHHFWALVNTLESCNGLVAVLQHFIFKSGEGDYNGSSTRLCVDVVAEKGRQWMKVVARNPRALSQLCSGAGEYGQRNVIDQAKEFLACAKQHLYMFRPPEVVFVFSSGIEESLANMLEDIGVIIVGKRMPDSFPCQFDDEDSECSDENEERDDDCVDVDGLESNGEGPSGSPEPVPLYSDLDVEPSRLNLDVTTLLAYVSALTNGGCKWNYKQPILREQAAQEMKHPVKPVLEALFEGKQLCVCKSAFDSFMTILNTLGGPGERERAAAFIPRLTVVEDGEETWENLKTKGRIKERSRAVFATGVALRAITVTANGGFVRSARNQGYEFPVFVHESRALTEGKQFGPPLL
ncbi:UPF0415 protein C7orf25 homolog [Ischnura elegans]|uniref:UPF0415 protein C7orf25 homolog n=1 Tax=Ischnura elegans TaxID=197161 RepID=UPI001ED89C22|nr:UPF0415 protein C7orf25 homolog [Ischnura elegans]